VVDLGFNSLEKYEFVRLVSYFNYWGKLKIHVPNHQAVWDSPQMFRLHICHVHVRFVSTVRPRMRAKGGRREAQRPARLAERSAPAPQIASKS